MKTTIIFSVLTVSFFLIFFFYTGYSIDWVRVDPQVVKIVPGKDSIIKIYVGEEVKNQYVKLTIIETPDWLGYSFSMKEGRTPFISNLTIRVPIDALTGNYTLKIGLMKDKIMLEQEKITLMVLPRFNPPTLYFTNYTCPSTVTTGGKMSLDLSFDHIVFDEARIRVKVLLDGQLETMIEFRLSGNGSIPMYRQITVPSEPKDVMITSSIEYFDSRNNTWIVSDMKACKVTVTPIPTIIRIVVTGLPLNVEVNLHALILPEGSIIERKVSSMSEHRIILSIHQPSTIIVMVDDEIALSNGTKYVAENNLREIYVEPGWTFTLQFNYFPFYLVSTRIEPDEDILKILEKDEWVKKGRSLSISVPSIFESSSKKYVLSGIDINGEIFNDVPVLEVRAPHTITYRYLEYNKLTIVSEVKLPETISSKKYYIRDLLGYVDESVGEYWVKKGEIVKIPFRGYALGDYRFVPSGFDSYLEADLKDGLITVVVDKPGSIKLYYNIEVKLNIIVSYSSTKTLQKEEWVPIGTKYSLHLDTLLSPTTVGERLELRNLRSDLTYEFIRDNKTIIFTVDSPGKVEFQLDRYFIVKVYRVSISDEKYPLCVGPPSLTEWRSSKDFDEMWVPEKTPLTCYFPERIDDEMVSILFVKGLVGDIEYEMPGLKSFYVEKPLTIRMKYNIIEYFQLKGKTDKGVFIGEGKYPRGAKIAWRVEPQEHPCNGLLGFLGFKLRATNPYGVEDIQEDKIVEVTWVLTPSVESPIIQLLQLASIFLASYIASIYHRMWKVKVRKAMRDDEDIES